MFTTADSTRRALLNSIRLALLVAAATVAAQVETNAWPKPRTQRGAARSQKPAASLPAFADYLAREHFKGRPAAVRLRTRRDRQFRTRLREGAAEGPNFAGRYTVVYWGCGTGCAQVAAVDAKTGSVHWPPLEYSDIPTPDRAEYDLDYKYGVGYRLDSRLLVLTRTHYDREGSYTAYFYVLDRGRFRLVREAVLKARRDESEGDQPRENDPVDPKEAISR